MSGVFPFGHPVNSGTTTAYPNFLNLSAVCAPAFFLHHLQFPPPTYTITGANSLPSLTGKYTSNLLPPSAYSTFSFKIVLASFPPSTMTRRSWESRKREMACEATRSRKRRRA